MRIPYPTFPNPAGIGSQTFGAGAPEPQAAQVPGPQVGAFIPMDPHPQIRLQPTCDESDPVAASDTIYNPKGRPAMFVSDPKGYQANEPMLRTFNPWIAARG